MQKRKQNIHEIKEIFKDVCTECAILSFRDFLFLSFPQQLVPATFRFWILRDNKFPKYCATSSKITLSNRKIIDQNLLPKEDIFCLFSAVNDHDNCSRLYKFLTCTNCSASLIPRVTNAIKTSHSVITGCETVTVVQIIAGTFVDI